MERRCHRRLLCPSSTTMSMKLLISPQKKIVIRMLRYSSPQLMASGRGVDGENLSFLYMMGHWVFKHASVDIWATKTELLFLLLGEVLRVREQTWED